MCYYLSLVWKYHDFHLTPFSPTPISYLELWEQRLMVIVVLTEPCTLMNTESCGLF